MAIAMVSGSSRNRSQVGGDAPWLLCARTSFIAIRLIEFALVYLQGLPSSADKFRPCRRSSSIGG